jgi:acyl-CoA synthetase (AMP-forming)/AMP-acid ligase II/acyl carrier protein
MLIEGGWKGNTNLRALCGGEALSRDLSDAVLARVAELWNLYGPTETTIWSAAARIEPGKAPISIGRPIENTRIYVTDHEGELSPIGIPGEILIAGDGVASGYHGRPEATADRFLRDRFAPNGSGRLYRTGDLGKWGANGLLYHLGRIDSQVKVRGFRIEVGEIEAILRQHPSVAQAVVVARELSPEDSRLVAYVVYAGEEATVSELRNHLRLYLPDYMVPALIVAIDEVPLTPNGKINAKALPDPFANRTQLTGEYVAPAPGIEELIADIWRDLLKVRNVSADDNFFELGGHSLLAVKVAAMVRKRTGRRLDPRTLYFQNLRQIAEVVIQERV